MTLKNPLNQIGLLLFLSTAMIMTSCDKDADTILEEEGISVENLYGKWSITSEVSVVTDAAGAELRTETENYANNMETIQFNENNSFLFISVEDGEWEGGDFNLNELDNTIDLDFDIEDASLEIIEFTTTSAQFRIVEEEEEDGQVVTFTNTITLTKNTGSEPGIDEVALKTRWSMGSNNVYVGGQLITADILDAQWMETVATINENRYTFDLTSSSEVLGVDNYMTGTYVNGSLEILDRSNFALQLEGSEDPILFHITSNSGSTELSIVHFLEFDEVDVKVQQDWTNDFTTPTLSAALIDGNWEVTAKSAGREINGQTASPDDEGPEVGNVLTFYSNGTGLFGQDQFTFEFIDANNMVLVTAGETDYTLIHFEAFNGTNEMTIWNMNSDWNEMNTSFDQDWIQLDMVKQQ